MPTTDKVRELTLLPLEAARVPLEAAHDRAEGLVTTGAQRVGSAVSTAVEDLRDRAPGLPLPGAPRRERHTTRNLLVVVAVLALLALLVRQRRGRGVDDGDAGSRERPARPTTEEAAAS